MTGTNAAKNECAGTNAAKSAQTLETVPKQQVRKTARFVSAQKPREVDWLPLARCGASTPARATNGGNNTNKLTQCVHTSLTSPRSLSHRCTSFSAAALTALKLTGTSSRIRHSNAGTGTKPFGVMFTRYDNFDL